MKETKPYSWLIGKVALTFLGVMALLGFNLLASLLITLVVVLGLMQFEDWWLSEEKLELTTKKREKSSLDMGIEAAQARRKIREENSPRGKIFSLSSLLTFRKKRSRK